ncbi:MAG: FAD:protein FMN transferase [Planctomycetota bacterium]
MSRKHYYWLWVYLLFAGCATPPRDREIASPGAVVHGVRHLFGCFFEFTIFDIREDRASELIEEAFVECEKLEALSSVWRPDSEIVNINKNAARIPMTASEPLREMLQQALDLSTATDGVFDITIGSVIEIYQLRSQSPRIPRAEELAKARASIGSNAVELTGSIIKYKKEGAAIDLDGCNKGFALDKAAEILRRGGVSNAILSAGGSSFISIGPPAAAAPRLIEITDQSEQAVTIINLRDDSLSTSGNWRRAHIIDGKEIGHIIDPRTGLFIYNNIVSTTVKAPTALLSDVLAKVAIILELDGSKPILQKLGASEAVWLYKTEPPGFEHVRFN